MKKLITICSAMISCLYYNALGAELYGVVYDSNSVPMVESMVGLSQILPDGEIGEDIQEQKTSETGRFHYTNLKQGDYILYGPGRGFLSTTISFGDANAVSNVVLTQHSRTHQVAVQVSQLTAKSDPLQVRLYPSESTIMSQYNIDGVRREIDVPIYIFSNLYGGGYRLSIKDNENRIASCNVQINNNPDSIACNGLYGTFTQLVIDIWMDGNKHTNATLVLPPNIKE